MSSHPFDFQSHCRACNACCRDQRVFLSHSEASRLQRTELPVRPNGSCGFFDQGSCVIHPNRPLECRMFPLDLKLDVETAKVWWIMWDHCPALEALHFHDETADEPTLLELERGLDDHYVIAYLRHHGGGGHAKHPDRKFQQVRPYKWKSQNMQKDRT